MSYPCATIAACAGCAKDSISRTRWRSKPRSSPSTAGSSRASAHRPGAPPDVADGPQWSYTVGLLGLADHPELICAGPEVASGHPMLNQVSRLIVEGRRFAPGDSVWVPAGVVRFGAVHPVQYRRDTFNMWHALQGFGAVHAESLEALQVFAPESWFCSCHRHCQPNLSDPAARVDAPLPRLNRAARRARPHPN